MFFPLCVTEAFDPESANISKLNTGAVMSANTGMKHISFMFHTCQNLQMCAVHFSVQVEMWVHADYILHRTAELIS